MKKSLLFAAIIGALTFVGCNKFDKNQEWGTYPEAAMYATVSVVDNLEDADKKEYIFTTDAGTKVFLVDSRISSNTEFKDGERMVISFTVIEDYTEKGDDTLPGAAYDCDYGLRLFAVQRVMAAQKELVTTEAESKAIADMKFSSILSTISYRNGFINLVGTINADDFEDVKVYIVDNQFGEPDETKKGYYNLELRLDRGTDAEKPKNTYSEYISIDMKEFAEEMKGMDGIILRVITDKSADQVSIKLEIKDEDDDKEDDKKSLNAAKVLL